MAILAGILQRDAPPDASALKAMRDSMGDREAAVAGQIRVDGRLGGIGVDEIRPGLSLASDALEPAALEAAFPDGLAAFDGPFALVAHDEQRRRLHLVRDRFGQRPLYYAALPGRFVFASEIHGLLAAGVPAKLEIETFRHHVARGSADGTQTCLEGISRVGAGEWLEVDTDTLELRSRTWHRVGSWLDPELAERLASTSREENADRVERALRESIALQLTEGGEVACLCSGGLDSSLITALAAKVRPDLKAFTMSLPHQPRWDEAGFAREVCDHAGVDLVEVVVAPDAWRGEMVRATCRFGYPYRVESGLTMSIIARRMREFGIGAALAGDCADTMFGGLDYKDVELRQRVGETFPSGLPLPTFHDNSWPPDPSLDKLLGVEGNLSASEDYLAAIRSDAASACAHRGGSHAELLVANVTSLRTSSTFALLQFEKAMRSYGISLREPFLDAKLVRIALNLPLDQVMSPKAKGVLRDVAARHLPRSVLERPKLGFSLDPAALTIGGVNPEFLLGSMLREVFGIKKDWKLLKFIEDGASRGRAVCRLISGEIWLRHFIGGQTVAEIEAALWR